MSAFSISVGKNGRCRKITELLQDYNNPFGNPTAYRTANQVATDPGTNTLSLTYGIDYNTFPALARNALDHDTRFSLDPFTGEVLKRLDPNGHLECWIYDNQHRLLERRRHSVATSISTTCNTLVASFDYPTIGVPDTQRVVTTDYPGGSASSVVSMRFFDGRGRFYKEAASTETSLYAVSMRAWGSRGEETCSGLPFKDSNPIVSSLTCETQRPYRSKTYDGLLQPLTTTLHTPTGAIWNNADKLESSITHRVATIEEDDTAIPGLELIEIVTIYGEYPVGLYPSGLQTTPSLERKSWTDVHGFRRAVQNNAANKTTFTTDALGRITKIDGPDVVREAGGTHENVLALEYDMLGRRKKLVQAANGTGTPTPPTWQFTWDLNGNLLSQIPPRGTSYQISYAYDELDRLIVKDVANSSADSIYTYDSLTTPFPPSFISFSNKGHLSRISGPGVGTEEAREYDLRGRLARKERQISAIKYEFRYGYDELGRRTSARYPDQVALDFAYTGPYLTSVKNHGTGTEYIGQVLYGASGRATRLAYTSTTNKVAWSEYSEDTGTLLPKQYLARINGTTIPGSGDLVDQQDFRFDVAGNLREASGPTGSLNYLSELYTYDTLHRLDWAQGTSGTYKDEYNDTAAYLDHDYDSAGNLIKKGRWTLSYAKDSYPANAVTKLISGAENLTYTYDPDGNLATRVGPIAGVQRSDTLTWDAEGRMIMFAVASGAQTVYKYDDDGSRTFKQLPGGQLSGSRTFVDPEYEIDPSGTTIQQLKHIFVDGRRVLSLSSDMDANSDSDPAPDRFQCDGYPSTGWENASPEIPNATSFGVPNACLCGDFNDDGVIAVGDVVGTPSANHCATSGGAGYAPGQLDDTNGDGACNVQDVIAVNASIWTHNCNLRCGRAGYVNGQTAYDLRAICRDTNRPQTELRYHSNQIGTNRLVTDQTGAIRQRTLTRPFGDLVVVLDGSGNPIISPTPRPSNYMFSDKYLDDESNFDYFEARYYDPAVGRFVSNDPALIEAFEGEALDRVFEHPNALDPYAYVINRPLMLVDPTGWEMECPTPDHCTITASRITVIGEWNRDAEVWNAIGDALAANAVNVLSALPGGGAAPTLPRLVVVRAASRAAASRAAARAAAAKAAAGARATPLSLSEKLALDEAKSGAGTRIMSGLIKDPRYPGDVWAKMQHVHKNSDGTQTVIHYWENLQTGAREGFKFK